MQSSKTIGSTLCFTIIVILSVLPINPALSEGSFSQCKEISEPISSIRHCTDAIVSGLLQGRDLSIVYMNRGIANKKIGEYMAAANDYEYAISADSSYHLPYYNRGNLRAIQNQIDLAISDYSRSLELSPDHARSYNQRGNLLWNIGRRESALMDYERACGLGLTPTCGVLEDARKFLGK